ncbi:MAG: DNA-directed RNA polymerase subunit beta' [Planctomycetota bacterium]|jgi:DNA-directed RNA polymerase subunit beta'|nr:DNA-directed RNA polymerase subunit beta' [Planctomycetota bacterium]
MIDLLEQTQAHSPDYNAVSIRLASPEVIRSWSQGEVKRPETINYRNYKAEKDGLFCEKIFGPTKDWECFCGKYSGVKYKGIVCEKCGVLVTHSRVRRERMGHINLVSPVVHIWFFKAMPSRLGNLLGLKSSSLQQVIYFQKYIVTDPGTTALEYMEILSEEQYRKAVEKYGDDFKAMMGAEAIQELVRHLDLETLIAELREELANTRAKQKIEKLTKRLRLAEDLKQSGNDPQWMIMTTVPVIPPDLRPLVPLENGNFATSDLNDLYRRVIYRNNRLKKLIELNAPGIIIRNEKRMLQQAVDALFDNGRCQRAVFGSGNRPLKSLTDMIKGKQGRFRENLLGKRVDYSARSVIVVGPRLKLHQCGLPKQIVLELFQPFIIRALKERGYAETVKAAKRKLERRDEEVWEVLGDVIKGKVVMLNRAPTLHRMGIQAFEPIVIEGSAIQIHPLVCAGFNADFDGDQMAVHLPLSIEAQTEARVLMLSTNNIFSPAHGNPIISADQDIVLGCYFLTLDMPDMPGHGKVFATNDEVRMALEHNVIELHTEIKVPLPIGCILDTGSSKKTLKEETLIITTPGRLLFNEVLPEGMPFYNKTQDKSSLRKVIADCFEYLGRQSTIDVLDKVKEVGFRYSTISGISFGFADLATPVEKDQIIADADKRAQKFLKAYARGLITATERHRNIRDVWNHATESVSKALMNFLANDKRYGPEYINPVYAMAISKARGSEAQVRQLAGMRGLMAKPNGEIIETPIRASFKDGLRVLEYFTSTHGARKGLADTALKTADSGYLTRKLVDVAQDVIINEENCGTVGGVTKSVVYEGEDVKVTLAENIIGRIARDTIVDIITDEVVVSENDVISLEAAKRIESMGFEKIRVRSPLTCESKQGICQRCYGMDLSRGRMVESGLAVGVIAAQSIGEPGTQLTMRTFHIGGVAGVKVEDTSYKLRSGGKVVYEGLRTVVNSDGATVVLNRNGEIVIQDASGREIERFKVPVGSTLKVEDNLTAKKGQIIAEWEAANVPILCEAGGKVRFEAVIPEVTMREERDSATGIINRIILEGKGDLHPQIVLDDTDGNPIAYYPIPEKATLRVTEGDTIAPGTLLASTPREMAGPTDITGGLPRVTELFEARAPKDPAVMAEIDGVVDFGERKRGKRTILVRGDSGVEAEHSIPQGKHYRVHKGDRVRAGDALVDGTLVPKDLLRICGEEALQDYLLGEIQQVYRAQNVGINDKHIEVIVRQMMRKVEVVNAGDLAYLQGQIADKITIRGQNQQALVDGKQAVTYEPKLMGITRASLQSESFISAASFQETTKVLADAALAGRVDNLKGLKENVILGHMVPCGTGFKSYLKANHERLGEPVVSEEDDAISLGPSEQEFVGAND